ncbi:hypothetical protein CDEST_05982 [Colletotrichum destructivum]|uniref:C2H2-type domain-containing protein n=1 Tax=Colletotrichum destructivum TaxID=34406 RepID=A0AAX4IDG1_9PEZI|nr:hypothetical protein CDEST_05982 [Colletotrichum destructivum]
MQIPPGDMSPTPPEKENPPVTDDIDPPHEDGRHCDVSSGTSDVETASRHESTDDARQEEDSFELIQTESPRDRPGIRGRLSRFLGRPLLRRQEDNADNKPPMKETSSPVPSQADSQHRVQQPSADIRPGPGVPEISSPADQSLSTKAKRKEHRRPKPSKGSESGTLWPEFLSETSVKSGAEDMSESLKQPGEHSPSPPTTLRRAVSTPRSGEGTNESSSGAEDEAVQEAEDPSRRVQRLMVDKVMSSFMGWLDTKLKVKDEDGSQEPEALLRQVPAWPSTSAYESRLLAASPVGRAGERPELGSAPLFSATSEIDFMSDDSSTPARRRISLRSKSALSSTPPPPPPPPSLPVSRAQRLIPDQQKTGKAVLLLSRGRPPKPESLEAAPPSRSSVQPANNHLGAPLGRSSASQVVPAAAPAPAPRSKRQAALPSKRRTARKRSQVVSPASQTHGKRPGKHDRSTDGTNEENDEEDNDDDDDDDDEDFSPRAKLPKVHEDGGNGARLACPFFKHNPRKYKNQRPCCGPGWDHVHRIKEHIYRKHSLPRFSCPRCCQPFETQADLQAHARSADACEVREPEALDGITQDQEKRLRSRKKTSAKELTEADKWTQVYGILFPDVREREIPSPYYNTEDAETNLGGYEDYLRRELPPLVRRRLEAEVERELSFVEEGMKQKVIDIARNLQLALFKGYQQLENQERHLLGPQSVEASASQTDRSTASSTNDTSPSTMTTSGTTPEIPDPLDIFNADAIPDFEFDFLSEVTFPEEKEPNLDFGFTQSFDAQQPATIQPGMELLSRQQFSLPQYGLEDYQDTRGHVRDAGALGYAP